MSRVITISRYYPKGHPRAGEQTNFVEKILKSFIQNDNLGDDPTVYSEWWCELLGEKIATVGPLDVSPKDHTIRAGNRWKVGDKFSPRVWSGRPYATKQITIAPDIEIKKIWTFRCEQLKFYLNDRHLTNFELRVIAENDGLYVNDFVSWFTCHPKARKKAFQGQILCWNESIEYA